MKSKQPKVPPSSIDSPLREPAISNEPKTNHRPETGAWAPAIQQHIARLIEEIAPGKHFENADVVSEIMVTALKAVESNVGRGDLKLLSRSIRELRYAFKIFKPYRSIRKVSMFGSARTPKTDAGYKIAKEFAKKLVEHGYMIITGAGPGIMEAGNEGAGPTGSFGVNIRLPYEQFANPFIINQPTYIDCRYFFTRKLIFIKETSASAFFPGGFGTLDEAFELLTLVQTGKSDPMPIVFVDVKGGTFWKDIDKMIRKDLLGNKKVSKEDFNLYKIVYSADDACKEILNFYKNYHSMRFVKDVLVMRTLRGLSKTKIDYLNKNFSEILTGGKFEVTGPLPGEENQPELKELPRLVFKFNRINNGRLRQVIDLINKD